MSTTTLKNGLNAYLDNMGAAGPFTIVRKVIRVYGESNWSEIRAALAQWEHSGFLRVLADPETAADDASCIEMHYYIDGQGGWPQLMMPR